MFVTLQEIDSLEYKQNDSMTGIRTTARSDFCGGHFKFYNTTPMSPTNHPGQDV